MVNNTFPSGKNEDDIAQLVVDMYNAELRNPATVVLDIDDLNSDVKTTPGYAVFILYGPYAKYR